ncbi:MAG: hypothetical protein ACOCXJ_09495, partial [Planctomycetota bacterium]
SCWKAWVMLEILLPLLCWSMRTPHPVCGTCVGHDGGRSTPQNKDSAKIPLRANRRPAAS